MPRIRVPPELANVTAGEAIEAIDANLNLSVPETTARNYVMRALAALGNTRNPQVVRGSLDGARVRLYIWEDSPLGAVALAAGPQWGAKFMDLGRLQKAPGEGIWLLASPDPTSASTKSAAYTKVLADRRSTRKAAEVMREEAKAKKKPRPRTPRPKKKEAPARRKRAPARTQTPSRPAPASVGAQVDAMSAEEQQEKLVSALTQLLGEG